MIAYYLTAAQTSESDAAIEHIGNTIADVLKLEILTPTESAVEQLPRGFEHRFYHLKTFSGGILGLSDEEYRQRWIASGLLSQQVARAIELILEGKRLWEANNSVSADSCPVEYLLFEVDLHNGPKAEGSLKLELNRSYYLLTLYQLGLFASSVAGASAPLGAVDYTFSIEYLMGALSAFSLAGESNERIRRLREQHTKEGLAGEKERRLKGFVTQKYKSDEYKEKVRELFTVWLKNIPEFGELKPLQVTQVLRLYIEESCEIEPTGYWKLNAHYLPGAPDLRADDKDGLEPTVRALLQELCPDANHRGRLKRGALSSLDFYYRYVRK